MILIDYPGGGRWETLAQAYAAHGFPPENLELIQRLVDHIGIDHYEGIESRGYIKAIRRDEGHWLWIHSGFTGGMASEAEVLAAVGDVDRYPNHDGTEWTIWHPVNGGRDGGSTWNRSNERAVSFCENHPGIALPASGICDECAA